MNRPKKIFKVPLISHRCYHDRSDKYYELVSELDKCKLHEYK